MMVRLSADRSAAASCVLRLCRADAPVALSRQKPNRLSEPAADDTPDDVGSRGGCVPDCRVVIRHGARSNLGSSAPASDLLRRGGDKSVASEVRGRHRIVDALEIMLKGTNLRYTVLSQDIISIHPACCMRARACVTDRTETVDRPDWQDEDDALEAVIVTATRVIRDGYEAPTPTTVVSNETLKVLAASNVADAVNFVPALAGSATPRSGNSGVSGGQAGTNTLDLRSMGANRTLVLMDGARLTPTALTGVVDINQLPDGLIERVDVVTAARRPRTVRTR